MQMLLSVVNKEDQILHDLENVGVLLTDELRSSQRERSELTRQLLEQLV